MKNVLAGVLAVVLLAGAGLWWFDQRQKNDLASDARAKFAVLDSEIKSLDAQTSECTDFEKAMSFGDRLDAEVRQENAAAQVAMEKANDRLSLSDARRVELSELGLRVSNTRHALLSRCQQLQAEYLGRVRAAREKILAEYNAEAARQQADLRRGRQQFLNDLASRSASLAEQTKSAQDLHSKIEQGEADRARKEKEEAERPGLGSKIVQPTSLY